LARPSGPLADGDKNGFRSSWMRAGSMRFQIVDCRLQICEERR
jgi:hypothetical protein